MARPKLEDQIEEPAEMTVEQKRALLAKLKAELEPESESQEVPPGMVPLSSLDNLVNRLGEAFRSAAPRRKLTVGEYDARSSFHKGYTKDQVPKLTRPFFENGRLVKENVLTVEEITRLNAITRSGRYIDRLVEVRVKPGDNPDETESIYINYGTSRTRLDLLLTKIRTNAEMLGRILEEQDAALSRRRRVEALIDSTDDADVAALAE